MSNPLGKISQGANNTFNQFSSSQFVQGTKEFLQSNSIIAKFAFLILVIVVFMMALRLGGSLMTWLFSPTSNPILQKCMQDGTAPQRIPQDPDDANAITIVRSKNGYQGEEFTWSIWLFIQDSVVHHNPGKFKHVFHKGNNLIQDDGLNGPNNAPGLYINPDTNALTVIMNTFSDITEKIDIDNLPLNKWVNVIMRVSNQRTLDVYINGTLTKRAILNSPPKQNYGDVYITQNGGFPGFTSELRYFSSALGTNKIQDIVEAGPNLNYCDTTGNLTKAKPYYLSTRWYFADQLDAYNPGNLAN